MDIMDFMCCSGTLEKLNYVMVEKNKENIEELIRMGCSRDEVESLDVEEDNLIDVYSLLKSKGYQFSPQKGFQK